MFFIKRYPISILRHLNNSLHVVSVIYHPYHPNDCVAPTLGVEEEGGGGLHTSLPALPCVSDRYSTKIDLFSGLDL